jgi:hypothetical protein
LSASKINDQELKNDYLSGKSGPDLADKYGVCFWTIYQHLKKAGVTRRTGADMLCGKGPWNKGTRDHSMRRRLLHYHQLKTRAKQRNKPFEFTFEQVQEIVAAGCFYCKGKLSKPGEKVGLDRIDNALGYSSGNVLPCCGVCNRMRSNMFSVEEARIMVDAVLLFRNQTLLKVI